VPNNQKCQIMRRYIKGVLLYIYRNSLSVYIPHILNTNIHTNAYKQKKLQWCLDVAITAPNKLSIPVVENCRILNEIM